ncbi:hypothetical protein RUM43_001600 [Polyplax serrata]|uniref:Uncharacterized protein n=1 Tax=Polyplax serrata TaxID=468196 RepID=A0AAN8XQI2_POLSC
MDSRNVKAETGKVRVDKIRFSYNLENQLNNGRAGEERNPNGTKTRTDAVQKQSVMKRVKKTLREKEKKEKMRAQ